MSSTSPVVHIVIVNYETSEMIRRCVTSLAQQDVLHRVVIVDNPSPAEDYRNLLDLEANFGVEIIRAPVNVGYGLGCNLGLESSTAPYVCVLNPDTALGPGVLREWVAALEQEMNGGRRVGLLAPALLNDNGSVQRSAYQFQNALNYWAYHSLAAGVIKTLRKRAGTLLDTSYSNRPARQVDWVMGAALLLPRTAWEAVSGFSPAYFLYAEDTDLCWRLRLARYEVLYQPGIAITHTQGEPSSENRGQSMVRLFRGLHTFIHQNYGFWKRTGVRVSVLLDMTIRIALYAPLSVMRPRSVITRTRLEGSVEVLKMFLMD